MENSERKNILENAIAFYLRQGYRVNSQTDNTVQLMKPKQFSFFVAIILFLIFIIPFVLYLLYYLAQHDKTVYIVVNEEGKISVTDEKGLSRIVDNIQQLAPMTYNSVPAESDPGYTKSTKIMLAVLAVVIIVLIAIAIMNNWFLGVS